MNIFLTSLVSILRKALPRIRHGKSEWIANHTGYLRFQAEVWLDDNDHFHAVVNKRSGWMNPRYEQAVDCGEFDSFHCAMNTAYSQALELAHLRYAWELTD
ncbi:hypothetical protein [Salmonella enterica]|uniref:hypothetical protein n=1 Tax=Salmonella enterica TaxID=28901 RepID=UPI000FA2B239|nr:hypothetical protein [Salmonella enterica]ECG7009911.1 hypothetical protein [Salmonella enterica subsp. enterica]EDZ5417317.1 hypothetical protein [Salmonella enterica subsp. enterica serovar Muenchen]EDU9994715.1 hypothetical protein [Salmonella enterica subsp. enterica]EEC0598701.1 hypothetical protein [Salmonella enterica subsp. enterica]EJY7603818.1 hypothetical protein [Salmonella enterica]